MGFKETLQARALKLTPAEQRVVTVLLGDPYETAVLAAAQVASTVGVHEATVTRLAQKLGYRGYPELRADLQRDAHRLASSATRARARVTKAHELNRLVEDEIQALAKLPEYLEQDAIDEAAAMVLGARRIYLFAANHATTLVEFMDRRLRRIGLDVVALRYQGRELAEHVVGLSKEDVVLAFAFKEEPPGLGDLFRHAEAVGCQTVLVTDPPGVLMRPSPTRLLVAPRGADEDFHTLVVPLVICYALQLAITNLDRERFGTALEQVDTLTRAYSADSTEDDINAYTRER